MGMGKQNFTLQPFGAFSAGSKAPSFFLGPQAPFGSRLPKMFEPRQRRGGKVGGSFFFQGNSPGQKLHQDVVVSHIL